MIVVYNVDGDKVWQSEHQGENITIWHDVVVEEACRARSNVVCSDFMCTPIVKRHGRACQYHNKLKPVVNYVKYTVMKFMEQKVGQGVCTYKKQLVMQN